MSIIFFTFWIIIFEYFFKYLDKLSVLEYNFNERRGTMVAAQLASIRKSRRLTMKEVAESLNISLSAYQKYENGTRDVSTEMLSKLADFYNVTTDYLLGRNTDEPKTIDCLAGEFNMSALEKKILDNYLALPKNMRSDLMQFLEKSVDEVLNNDF